MPARLPRSAGLPLRVERLVEHEVPGLREDENTRALRPFHGSWLCPHARTLRQTIAVVDRLERDRLLDTPALDRVKADRDDPARRWRHLLLEPQNASVDTIVCLRRIFGDIAQENTVHSVSRGCNLCVDRLAQADQKTGLRRQGLKRGL